MSDIDLHLHLIVLPIDLRNSARSRCPPARTSICGERVHLGDRARALAYGRSHLAHLLGAATQFVRLARLRPRPYVPGCTDFTRCCA